MSVLTVAGPYSASAVALGVAVWGDQMRRRDRRTDLDLGRLAEARNVVVVSWDHPHVINASAAPIRDVTLLGGDRYFTKHGGYIDWHCEPTLINGSVPSLALLQPQGEHHFVDGSWRLSDQAGIMYGGDWQRELDSDDRGVAARIEWTDPGGNHWQRTGTAEPVRLTERTKRQTFPARPSP